MANVDCITICAALEAVALAAFAAWISILCGEVKMLKSALLKEIHNGYFK